MRRHQYKILLSNIGYCTGLNGSYLKADKHLRVINTQNDKTFSAHCPGKVLDIFMVSKNITVNGFHVLQDQFPDHLPVIIEFKI